MLWSTIVNRKRRSHKDATHTSHAIFGAATSCRATSKTIVRFRVIRKAVCRWKDARLRRYGDRRVIDRSCRKRGGCEQGVDRGSRGEAGMRADSRQSRADRRADRQFLASPPISLSVPFASLMAHSTRSKTYPNIFVLQHCIASIQYSPPSVTSRRFWEISSAKKLGEIGVATVYGR